MKAHEIMTSDPATCTGDDTMELVARLMETRDCGCIPVVANDANRQVLGVITDRDIAIRGVAQGKKPKTKVSELMTRSPFCCNADSDIDELERVMAEHQVRRVVIVDGDNRCVGIVAQADLARAAEQRRVSEQDVAHVVEKISEPRKSSQPVR